MPRSSPAELTLPAPWRERALRTIDRLKLPTSTELEFVLGLSSYVERVAGQQTAWLIDALEQHAFAAPLDLADWRRQITTAAAAADTTEALQRTLRQLRNRSQVHIVWRHLLGLAPLEETIRALSGLADQFIDAALERLMTWLTAERGVPRNAAGEAQSMVVLALGKLGAGELNLSSDVDLLFCYPEPGTTDQGLTNDQFFTRLGQQLHAVLDRLTADGFVYRVDLRLRPFGASGPLVSHFDAIEQYYQREGRDWERYALQKARVCAGDQAAGAALLERLEPFVYRRYLDFGMLEALRDMKAAIIREHRAPANVKLGPGGIRDVEFTIQVLQLIWGGHERALRTPVLQRAAAAVIELELLPLSAVDALLNAYRLLRDAEHSLQAFDDQQTQLLPDDDDGLLRVALSLGFPSAAAFSAELTAQRAAVQAVFAELIAPAPPATADAAEAEAGTGPLTPTGEWWHSDAAALTAQGFATAETTAEALERLYRARQRRDVDAAGRERLDALLPRLLAEAVQLRAALLDTEVETMPGAASADYASGELVEVLCDYADLADRAVQRVVPLLIAVLRRSAYLALLLENPNALRRLLLICAASRWLAERLGRHPAFLDALLDERQLEDLPDAPVLRAELRERLAPYGGDDERWYAELRDFKESHHFTAALGQVRGTLPLMRTSDYLTFLAEAVLQAALDHAWRQHAGEEVTAGAGDPAAPPFLILAFGKLGGFELGPDSDLDLVFVHDLGPEQGRLLQRVSRSLLATIGTQTSFGPLYSVDTRLRPAGAAGTMVTRLDAFERYQLEQAWTWEHQALVRARPVVGSPELAARFEALRERILGQPRDPEQLRVDVLAMHERLRQHFRSLPADVKRSAGGIVDIEFLVQHLVLAQAHEHPQLALWTDNVRILETAAAVGVLATEEASALTAAYLALRTEGHRAVLDLPDAERGADTLAQHRDLVAAIWQARFGVPLDAIAPV
ncbi:MAG: bifunctional [glutamate--ammonia ligase]-adenylyl-L-tyrosine phosphorylase/[glutamate--ammonia-ligase] adenylyltransferase [Pseudomonadota bacterium]